MALVVLLASQPARADLDSGKDLLAVCASDLMFDRRVCFAYLKGGLDAYSAMQAAMKAHSGVQKICPPPAAPTLLQQFLVNRLKGDTLLQERPATVLVLAAMAHLFQCGQKAVQTPAK